MLFLLASTDSWGILGYTLMSFDMSSGKSFPSSLIAFVASGRSAIKDYNSNSILSILNRYSVC